MWPPSLLESSPSHVANPPKATYPLLTSSGRAFAVGDKCDIWAAEGGQWFAKLKKGACVFVPKAFNFSGTVAGRITTGCWSLWHTERYHRTDRPYQFLGIGLHGTVTAEALNASGITDLYELCSK